MDVNGTRLHLVLGLGDWEASIVPPADPDVCYDRRRDRIGLRPRPFVFPTRAESARLTPDDRRGAGADRYGNLFWIGPARRSVLAARAGADPFVWWSSVGEPDAEGPEDPSLFVACEPRPVAEVELSGLAVTDDQYLVIGVVDLPVPEDEGDAPATTGGLLVFDLAGGGPPVPMAWPPELGVRPFDLTAMPGGGVTVLDLMDPAGPGPGRLWHLDCHFRLVPPGQPGEAAEPLFGPVVDRPPPGDVEEPATGSRGTLGRAVADQATTLDGAWPIAVVALADGSVLVLDRVGETGRLEIGRWRCGAAEPFELHLLEGPDGSSASGPDDQTGLLCSDQAANAAAVLAGAAGHDLAVAVDDHGEERLFVVDDRGDQAFELALIDGGAGAELVTAYHPLRLFSGKAIVDVGGTVHYDLADRWYPVAVRPIERYSTDAVMVLAPEVEGGRGFDAGAPGTVWHRLTFDGTIPPGCAIGVETRVADDPIVLEGRPWQPEPDPYRRDHGSEIAYHDIDSGHRHRDDPGRGPGRPGTWELLMQRAVGRYLQVRLTLRGDGRRTPRLWAVRVHFPRFAYLEEYLPAIYREDREAASFLDRYLANVEGLYTTLEGRLRDVRRLVDPDTIDAEYLPWLASWVGAAVETDWEPARQRLLVRHAARMFTRRGTERGLVEAIRLATHPCPSDALFDPAVPTDTFDVRIVESFRTRSVAGVVFGNPNDLEGPRYGDGGPRWELPDGGAQLELRWRSFTAGLDAPASFPTLTPAEAGPARNWHDFIRRDLAMAYADVGTGDDEAWQAYLNQRYRRIDDYRAAWRLPTSTGPDDFGDVTVPTTLPADGAPLEDWIVFVSSVLPILRSAHRATVLVPIRLEDSDDVREQRLGRVRRVVDLERPAATLVDVQPYWAACRVGEARVGYETIVGEGGRYVDLVLGAERLAKAATPGGSRWRLEGRTVVGRDRVARSPQRNGTGGMS